MKKRVKPLSILVTMALGAQLLLPSAGVFAAEGDVYFKDYNDNVITGWSTGKGTATFAPDNGTVKAVTTGAVILADTASPSLANGEYEVKLKFAAVPSRFGLVYRYADSNNYNVIQYDVSSWGWDSVQNGSETYGNLTSTNSPTFEANKTYTFKLRYVDDSVQLWIDGVSVLNTSLPTVRTGEGKIGLRSWFNNKTITIDDVKVSEAQAEEPVAKPITVTDTIGSEEMSVVIDQEFPRVQKYKWKANNAEMHGQINGLNEVKINQVSYFPTAKSYNKSADGSSAAYMLEIPEISVKFDAKLSVQDNELKFEVLNLREEGAEKVKTIEFPNHDLISVNASEPKAQETAAWITGDWVPVQEEYKDLVLGATDVNAGRTYAFLNNDKLAASVITNVVNGFDKVRVKVANDTKLNQKKAAVSGGSWIYRNNSVLEPEALPTAKVVLTPDANDDGIVDWQDGAIAYREAAPTPQGSDMISDTFSYISMNIGSTNTSPFLRAFDNAKKISNLTDGFGQIVLYKGYQAEGHDDSHPDYGGHIGIRQGGKEDFNFVLEEGKKYNIYGGVHINATEYMTDAFEFEHDNMALPLSKGWGWLDQAYYVNKTKDVESGELERRLQMLKDDTGDNLSFVYVDVYSGADYNAKKLAEYINERGWMLGTEYAGPLFEQAAWVHWGTDPAYPNKGNDSKIVRFLRNTQADGFLATPLLKGMQQAGVGYWQGNPESNSYKSTTSAFFNHNLPTKYMQNFGIMKLETNRILFEDNVKVERLSDGKIHLSKDGHDVAIMTDSDKITNSTVFIPWDPQTEDKIYHWNPAGGATTWTVPASWNAVETAKLYKLTDLGREFVADVQVTNDQVTLNAEAGTGYVLYPDTAPVQPAMVWGEGSPVKDIGFDSQGFDYWSKSAATTDHIKFVKNNNADDQLQVAGPADATIQQEITGLEAGKSYSASVWVSIDGKRKVEIGVQQGDDKVVNDLDNTEHGYLGQQHKYYGKNFQRIKVSFDAKSDKALFTLKAAEGNATVLFDDVRVWENPTKTDAGESVLFEDFENVDEGWGPFVYSKSGPVRTHLVEKAEDPSTQYFSYVLDGKWSLKTNEENTGSWLRTLPHTLRLEEDRLYNLTMDYNSDQAGMYSVAIRVKENGVVRELAIKELAEGENKLDMSFSTDGAKDAYLEIVKNFNNNQKELTGTLVLDNIRVNDEGQIEPEEGVLVEQVILSPQSMELNKGQSTVIGARVEPANAFDRSLTWTSSRPKVASVDATGKVTALATGTAVITATAKDASGKTAAVTVNVYKPNVKIPQAQMTATASGFQPGDEPSNALDGDASTMWHTPWYSTQLPASITLDLGGSYVVNQLNYTPRTSGQNGNITSYNLYASTNGTDFTLVTSGTWEGAAGVKALRFAGVEATHLKLEATAGMGNFASAAELNVFRVESEVVDPSEATHLAAPATVVSGQEFAVTLGLRDIEQDIYAQRYVVDYDESVMEFIGMESLIPGVAILEPSAETAGKVQIVAASQGQGNSVTGNPDVMKLTFKAKNVEDKVSGSIAIALAEISTGLGEESTPALVSSLVEITPAESSGDLNGDDKVSIGDLAMIAAHYGKTDQSPDWNEAKQADVNRDGKIDLADLVFVASKMI
ncbi:endo-alpha-N-acetylgalactosaminidase family protein [Paenibacillus sp. LHD-117]|uniref:endo-alpha-N-acetylgalactosaminidase family protein n=1 Tax=Paenibacillus sp. LHD-117 TaxID=3071412 RepID=UPI0027E1DC51|nr:endo-alpha-N-acetylgalactosaminidase family protein [Paenibacillus sp. LHD-117]MDQ6422158.1 endo-alpha-N-acetylgalactosaminidase family protein [Paenibacillus sp. LHD-117]